MIVAATGGGTGRIGDRHRVKIFPLQEEML